MSILKFVNQFNPCPCLNIIKICYNKDIINFKFMCFMVDQEKIQELLTRGVENIYPNKEFLEAKLKKGEKLTLYTGYDPTGPTLHLGHGITMVKLKQFQDLGCKIIMLIGDFTGMIGDPTDKTSARTKLTREQVLENCKNYKEQASAILDFEGENPVEVKYNSEWLGKMSFSDVIELASNFTVQRMMERDMFQRRLEEEKPIYVHEFMYPMMQGYDSVAMDVDGEVGGNDQTFNMLAGRHLMKDLGKKEKFVLTTKLLVDSSGKKMGKSEGNAISLDDSPEDMFGKVMSWGDDMIERGFELCTNVPMNEVQIMMKEIVGGINPRDIKLKLAGEVLKMFLNEDAAEKGLVHFKKVVQNKEIPDDIEEKAVKANRILDILVEVGAVTTTSDARRMIKQGAVKLNGRVADSIEIELDFSDKILLQKGKRFFVYISK